MNSDSELYRSSRQYPGVVRPANDDQYPPLVGQSRSQKTPSSSPSDDGPDSNVSTGVTLPAMNRQMLYQSPETRVCYFYRDGNSNSGAVKVVVNQRLYPTIDRLKEELTRRVDGLPFGVRGIYTPTGREAIESIDQLHHDGRYVCSTVAGKARGVDSPTGKQQVDGGDAGKARGVDILRADAHGNNVWVPAHRVSSGRRALNALLRGTGQVRIPGIWQARQAWGPGGAATTDQVDSDREVKVSAATAIAASRRFAPKKIVVIRFDEISQRQTLLLSRRTSQSFEQILGDLSTMFQTTIRNIYTIEGRQVRSLSAIFGGPDIYLATGGDPLSIDDCYGAVDRLYAGGMKITKYRSPRRRVKKHKPEVETKGKWKVWIATNQLPSAGTRAQVSLVVYGSKGCSRQIPLGNADGSNFQAGSIDEFMISIGKVGEIFKIRISHDNSGDYPSWFCDEVRMKDVHTGEDLTFVCQRWLSREEDDGDISREIPVVRNGIPALPLVSYEVTVVTGDLWNAGINANVYLALCGAKGDTGFRQLVHARTSQKRFQAGMSDIFTIEAVSVGKVSSVVVEIDDLQPGHSWYLDRVVVRDMSHPDSYRVFPCRQWLEERDDDETVSVELQLLNSVSEDLYRTILFEYEKWKLDSGSQVCLYSQNSHKRLRILPDGRVDACGESDDVTTLFTVVVRKGAIRALKSVANPHLHLAIDNGTAVGLGKGGALSEMIISINEDRTATLESVKFESQFITILQNGKLGNCLAPISNMSRQFLIYCKGAMRDQGIIMLCTSISQTLSPDRSKFLCATGKRSRRAQFRVHKVAPGVRAFECIALPQQFIRLVDGACDLAGNGDESCHFIVHNVMEKSCITLESANIRGMCIGMTNDGGVQPTLDAGDKNARLYPEVVQFGISSREPTREMSPTPSLLKTRIIPLNKKPPEPAKDYSDGDWKIQILTTVSAENARVALVVYGDQGSSGPIILGQSDHGLFQAGNIDEFQIKLTNVGLIYKIRLELTSMESDKTPSWKVKTVKMQDMNNKEVLKFHFDSWLSRHEGNGQLVKELPAVRPQQETLPLITYYLHTYTGSLAGADTVANVCINLFGERGDTGNRALLRSNNKIKFQSGQIDVFELDAVSLGKLRYCIISHDGDRSGEGWFCEQVVVREGSNATHEYVFPCSRWLDTGADDNKIERILKPRERIIPKRITTPKPPTPVPSAGICDRLLFGSGHDGEWMVWVSTGPEEFMTTTGTVTLCAYGSKAVSEPVVLGSGKDGAYFQLGSTDEFKVDFGLNLGQLFKIRFELQNHTGWFLEKVKLKHLVTGDVISTKVGRWLSMNEDDGDVCREIAIANAGKRPLPVIIYTVEVYTGSSQQFGEDAIVYLQMFGRHGDTGRRLLHRTLSNNVAFLSTQMDIFEVEAVFLGAIEKIIVSIDCGEEGLDGKWLCEKIFIREGRDSSAPYLYFPCGEWLESSDDLARSKILLPREKPSTPLPRQPTPPPRVPSAMSPTRDLFTPRDPTPLFDSPEPLPASPQPLSRGEFTVRIVTADDSRSPPYMATAWLEVYGDKTNSKKVDVIARKRGTFDAGSIHELEVSLGEIGDLYKIRVTRDESDEWSGWHLHQVKLSDKDTKAEYVFDFDRWMSREVDDFDLARELPVMSKDGKPVLPIKFYDVFVYNGNRWAAGTDANVFLTIYGSKGDSGERKLYHVVNNTQKLSKNEVNVFTFEAVSLENLTKVNIRHDGIGHGAGWFLDKIVIREREGENIGNVHLFSCDRWFDDHEDDGEIARDIALSDTAADLTNYYKAPARQTKTQGLWSVTVKTSDIENAGTSAKVSLMMYGEKSKSGLMELKCDDQKPFQRGKESTFTVNAGDIGSIYKVRLEHDNSNSFPAWHVHKITLLDDNTSEKITFYPNRWLAEDEMDNQLCCELPVQRAFSKPPVLRYCVALFTTHVTNTSQKPLRIFVTIHGERGDSGRRPLTASKTSPTPFAGEQVDVFFIPAVHLGKPIRIVVDVVAEAPNCSIFFQKLIVKESLHALVEFNFPCQRWIDSTLELTETGTQLVCLGQRFGNSIKELSSLNYISSSIGSWTMWISTASDCTSTALSSVGVIFCGTKGNSVALKLIHSKSSNSAQIPDSSLVFNPSAVDKFELEVGEVGEIVKLRFIVKKDAAADEPLLWHLQKLRLKHTVSGQELFFPCNKWVQESGQSTSESIIFELAAVRPDVEPLKEKKYSLSILTGDLPRAETDAVIYCIIAGDQGDTGKRILRNSKSGGPFFRRAQEDTFELNAVDIGKITSVTIGHDTIGRGRGWYCSSIQLCINDAETQLVFPCNRWLDTGCEDRQTVRRLLPLGEVPIASKLPTEITSKGALKVQLTMANPSSVAQNQQSGDDQNSNNNNGNSDITDEEDDLDLDWDEFNFNSNNGNAFDMDDESAVPTICVYGINGMSGPHELGASLFNQPGAPVDVNLSVGNVGSIYKVRVCSECRQNPQSCVWLIGAISLQDVHTKELLTFDFSRFIGEVGGDICKEMPAIRPNTNILQVIPYKLVIKSGEVDDNRAPTSVYVTLHGSRGDSGARLLRVADDGSTQIGFKEEAEFTVEAVDLGDLQRLTVTKSPGFRWNLQQITVKKGRFCAAEDVFKYEKVIDDSEDADVSVDLNLSETRKSSVVLPLNAVPGLPKSEGVWSVSLTTGDQTDAWTVGNEVGLVICGEKCESQLHPLVTDETSAFRCGHTSTFTITVVEDIGEVFKVRVRLIGKSSHQKWYLKKMYFEDQHTHDDFEISVEEWIVESPQEFGCKEYPVMWPGVETPEVVSYHLETFTGYKVDNAGTTANVYVIINADNGATSGKIPLKKSLNNEIKFLTGKCDLFELSFVEMTSIDCVVIGHDGIEEGAGWFLDKVIIRKVSDPDREYHFRCERWLDKGQDDGAIERILHLHNQSPAVLLPPPAPKAVVAPWAPEQLPVAVDEVSAEKQDFSGHWFVWIAGMDDSILANKTIVLAIYGSEGTSEDASLEVRTLGRYIEHSALPQARCFSMKCDEDLGIVYKIRLGLESDHLVLLQPLLRFSEIIVENMTAEQDYTFKFNSEIAFEKNDWLEVPVWEDDPSEVLPVCKYEIQVFSRDLPVAMTEINAYIKVVGLLGDTGRHRLTRVHLTKTVTDGSGGVLELLAVDLEKPVKVIVGHNGAAGQGFFLEKILVTCQTESTAGSYGTPYCFPCHRWLDLGRDDGCVERELELGSIVTPPADNQQSEDNNPDEWKVSVTTGVYEPEEGSEETVDDTEDVNSNNNADGRDKKSAKYKLPPKSPTCGLVVVLYGDLGKTSTLPLVSSAPGGKNCFIPGCADDFKVTFKEHLGEIYKVRIGFSDEDTEDQNWLLDTMVLQDPRTGREYTFELKDRIIRDEELDGWKEIPVKTYVNDTAEHQNNSTAEIKPLPVLKYKLDVYTGDLPESNTRAAVYIMLVGERGDTGHRKLMKSLTANSSGDMFQQGQVDVFEIEAVDLFNVTKVIVGHNGKEAGHGWYLNKVVVSVVDDAESTWSWTFNCQRWFDVGKDDGQIEREVQEAASPADVPPAEGIVEAEWIVSITTGVYEPTEDEDEDAEKGVPVEHNEDEHNAFNEEEVDELEEGKDATEEDQGEPEEEGGEQEQEEDEEEEADEDNMNNNADDDVEVVNNNTKKNRKSTKYLVPPKPPTCSLVMVLYGDAGKTQPLPLLSSAPTGAGSFQPGSTDDFKVQFKENIGNIYKVRIGFTDDNQDEQNWLVDSVVIQDPKSGKHYVFELKDRLIRDSESDGWIEIPIKPEDDGHANESSQNSSDIKSQGALQKLPVLSYKLDITTGNLPEAGTSATVYAMLVGERGDTGQRKLLKPLTAENVSDSFQQGQTDIFEIEAVDLLKITKVIIGHDGKETGQGWYVDTVVVSVVDGTETTQSWIFNCHRWFDVGKDDGLIERELEPSPFIPLEEWKVSVITGVYEPEKDQEGVNDRGGEEGQDEEEGEEGQDEEEGEEGQDEEESEEGQNEEDDNTNNNALNRSEDDETKINAVKNNRKIRYKTAPKPPTCNILVVLYGDRGKTQILPLMSSAPDGVGSFQPGCADEFKVRFSDDIGEVYKLRIGFADDNAEEQNWLLDTMVLQDPKSGRRYSFELKDRIIRADDIDGWREIPVKSDLDVQPMTNENEVVKDENEETESSALAKSLPVLTYCLDVFTGDIPDASTSANVQVMLVGERGDTGYRKLLKSLTADDRSESFQQGQMGIFEIEAVDLLNVTNVIIGHDGNAAGQGWYLDKVVVSVTDGTEATKLWTFSCQRWLDVGKDDGLIERDLQPVSPPEDVNEEEWKVSVTTGVYEPEEENNDHVEKDQGGDEDGEQEEQDENINNNAINRSADDEAKIDGAKKSLRARYKVAPKPPTCGILVVLYGDRGKTQILPLLSSAPGGVSSFQPGSADEFKVRFSEDLGEVYKLRIGFADDNKEDQNWLLDTMVLQDPKTGSQYSFELKDRIIRDDDHDGWIEIPVKPSVNEDDQEGTKMSDNNSSSSSAKPLPVLTYCVDVFTGDVPNAGTNANVHVMLIGERGDTGYRKLLKSLTADDKSESFQQGQVGIFEIQAVDLQTVTKVIIGHDGKEVGHGWYLDKVVVSVTDAAHATQSWIFSCQRWFDTGKDDGLIEREVVPLELEPEPEPATTKLEDGYWKVMITSGIYVADPKVDDKNPEHDTNTSKDPAAGVEDVEVGEEAIAEEGDAEVENDEETNEEAAEDEQLENEEEDEENAEAETNEEEEDENANNNADDKTDSESEDNNENDESGRAAATPRPPNSPLGIVIYGDIGKSALLPLVSEKPPSFQPGVTEEFQVKVPHYLGNIYKLRIGYTDDVLNDENWLLDTMILQDLQASRQYRFELKDRLIRNADCDGWKEIPLTSQQSLSKTDNEEIAVTDLPVVVPLPVCKYQVEVHTGSLPNAGTDAEVYLTLYGERGDTGQRKLLKPLNLQSPTKFNPDQVDVFEIEAVHLENIKKVIIGHNERETGRGWLLKKIVVRTTFETTPKKFTFLCDRWLDTGEDDGLIERKLDLCVLAAEWKIVVVKMEATPNGTDAATNENTVPPTEDVAETEVEEHNEDENGDGEEENEEEPAANEDEEITEQEAEEDNGDAENNEEEEGNENNNADNEHVKSDSVNNGTETDALDDNLVVVIYGDRGKTQPLLLTSGELCSDERFPPGSAREYKVTFFEDIGSIYKLRIGFNEQADEDQNYQLDRVLAQGLFTGNQYMFELHDQLIRDMESDGWKELPVNPTYHPAIPDSSLNSDDVNNQSGEQQENAAVVQNENLDQSKAAAADTTVESSPQKLPVFLYKVGIYLGDLPDAGTTANMYLTLIGDRGDTGRRRLLKSLTSSIKFQPKQVDIFEIEAVDLLDVKKIIVGHDGIEGGAGCFLDKIIVYAPNTSGVKVSTFYCDRYLDTREDDGLIERELTLETNDDSWLMSVTTTNASDGGLSGQVTVTVFGDAKESMITPLGCPGVGLFQTGATDVFDLKIPRDRVGQISKLRIQNTNRETKSGWHLDKIVLEKQMDMSVRLEYIVQRWLSVDEDDGDVVREMMPVGSEENVVKYMVQTETGDSDEDPVSGVYIILFGEHGDSGIRFLSKSKEVGIQFDILKTDTFHVEAFGLGELQKILVGFEYGTAWPLEKVSIRESDDAKEEYIFVCEKRSEGDETEPWTYIELNAVKQEVQADVDNSDNEAPAEAPR